jgi:hypothetical protein
LGKVIAREYVKNRPSIANKRFGEVNHNLKALDPSPGFF